MSFSYDGMHLMIDAVCSDNKNMSDNALVVETLEKIVEDIDMTMILPPVTVKFPHATSEMTRVLSALESEGLGESETAVKIKEDLKNRRENMYGFSTFIVIAESHMSIHTFPEANFFSFDCYSCKKFDHSLVLKRLTGDLGITSQRCQVVDRLLP
tara:strand:- start:122 stop:586 length:465 start_codon:yes stop_codon:yes gene_type:complete